MSASNKVPEGLKDSECKKGNLGACPPIPYVPPTDLLQAKENSDSVKLKLPDGTVISMTIFAKGNPEESYSTSSLSYLTSTKNRSIKFKFYSSSMDSI